MRIFEELCFHFEEPVQAGTGRSPYTSQALARSAFQWPGRTDRAGRGRRFRNSCSVFLRSVLSSSSSMWSSNTSTMSAMPCTSTRAWAAAESACSRALPCAASTALAGRAVMKSSSRSTCFAARMRAKAYRLPQSGGSCSHPASRQFPAG